MTVKWSDAALGTAAIAAALAQLAVDGGPAGSFLFAAGLGVLALRRAAPLATSLGVTAVLGLDAAVGGTLLAGVHIALIAAIVAAYSLGRHAAGAGAVLLGYGTAVAGCTLINQLTGQPYSMLDDLAFFVLVLGAPAALGRLLLRREREIASLTLVRAELAETQALAVAAAATEERARLSIAVHDVVAHRVAEIAIQAAGLSGTASMDATRGVTALAAIEAAGRAALQDIREVIGVLRRSDTELTPAPAAPVAVRPALPSPDPDPDPEAADPAPVPSFRIDRVAAALVFVTFAVEMTTSSRLVGPIWANVAAAALVAAPIAFLRRAPLPATAAVYGAAALTSAWLTPLWALVTPILLLFVPPYAVAAYRPLRPALAGLGLCLAGSLVLEPGVAPLLIGVGAWGAGRIAHGASIRAAELRATTAELERSRATASTRARSEERLRAARSLHDAVAHRLTVIVLQAAAAQRVWATDPRAARVAVEALAGVAREALGDLRESLHDAGRPGRRPLRSTLDGLAARVGHLGVSVVLDVDEHLALPADIAALVELVAEEALTNVARHAAPTSALLTVARRGERVGIEVTDAGRAGPDGEREPLAGSGTGLQGLAERIVARGGRLRHGPHGDGYRVEAELPLEELVTA